MENLNFDIDFGKNLDALFGLELHSKVEAIYQPFGEYHHFVPIIAVIIYYLAITILPIILKGKKNLVSRPVVAVWNLFLTVLSFLMFLHCAIPSFAVIKKYGLVWTICNIDNQAFEQSGNLVWWTHVFVVSKFLELFDTLFLILKNPDRSVLFLHWYHHISVLLFVWYGWSGRYGICFVCGPVNIIIHTIMYLYYFLRELGIKPPGAIFITMGQIIQMVIGLYVTGLTAFRRYVTGEVCNADNFDFLMLGYLGIYFTYLILFLQFFVKRYLQKQKKK